MRARPRHAGLRQVGALLGAAVLCGAGVGAGNPIEAVAATATHAGAVPAARAMPTVLRRLHPTAGVTVWHQRFTAGPGHAERAVLMRVDLRPGSGVHVDAVMPHEAIGGPRRSVVAEANVTRAVAGVNGDWFDMTTNSAVPRGAVIRGGRVLKSPRPGWRANLMVQPDGTAAIGQIPFHGSVRADGSRLRVLSINTPDDAAHGHVTYLTHALVRLGLRRPCTVAYGRTDAAGRVITDVETGVTAPPRVAAGRWALAACTGDAARWLRTRLHAGSPVTVSLDFPDGTPRTAVSGGRVLVRGGRPYVDVGGQRLWGANPETFACVSRSGRSLLLGVVDGRSDVSWGVTQPQLSRYMLQLNCWDGMTLDGGGSSTLVSRLPGTSAQSGPGVTVLNQPSDGRPRKVADSLFVFADGTAARSQ